MNVRERRFHHSADGFTSRDVVATVSEGFARPFYRVWSNQPSVRSDFSGSPSVREPLPFNFGFLVLINVPCQN